MENLTLATNRSECSLADATSRWKLYGFVYLAIILAAIPCNAFSLCVAWQHIRLKNELGVYLFNLAISDLTFSMGLSLWLDYLWRGVWIHGGNACVLSIFILLTNFYTSDALLCCIAVNRYLAVAHPFKYTYLRTTGAAVAVSVAILVVVVCFNATTITWDDTYQDNGEFSLCFEILPVSDNLVRANLARFFMGFVVPVLLVAFSTCGICEAVKSNKATEEQERKRISKLLALILLCLLLCFGPVHVVMLLLPLVDGCKDASWLHHLNKISIAISGFNCIADPLLYCFVTRTGKANVSQVVLFFQDKKRSTEESVV